MLLTYGAGQKTPQQNKLTTTHPSLVETKSPWCAATAPTDNHSKREKKPSLEGWDIAKNQGPGLQVGEKERNPKDGRRTQKGETTRN